jgi:hypothetical protein
VKKMDPEMAAAVKEAMKDVTYGTVEGKYVRNRRKKMKREVTIKILPANWRTTLAGLALGVFMAVKPLLEAGTLTLDQFVLATTPIVLGYLAKDAGVSGEEK